MFNTTNHIGNKITQTLGKIQRLARGKAMLATAVAATGLGCTASFGAVLNVQSISTQFIPGTSPTIVDNVSGVGISSGFTASNSYNLSYAGDDLEVTKIVTSGGSYVPTVIATKTVVDRSNAGPNNSTIFYAGTGVSSSKTLDLQGPYESSEAAALDGNNLLVGADNVFSNQGNPQNNNENIERVDMLFNSGVQASANNVFAIFERGLTTIHDSFEIAAITSLDSNGNPASYGPVLEYAKGTWGQPIVVPNTHYVVTRSNNNISNELHPSDQLTQPIGGVVVPSDSLVSNGTEIYGYSLFATDTHFTGDGSGTQLVNYDNSAVFPTNTPESVGGIDLVDASAILYTSAIPEPATGSMAAIAIAAMLSRRPRRRANKA